MIKVKVTTQHPNWPLLRQTPNSSGIWKDYQFFINQDINECDYWIVCDGLLKEETVRCPYENTILVTWEPPTIKTYSQKFIDQFATVVTCQKDIKHPNIIYSQQAHPWFVNKTYDELKKTREIQKAKLLSIVTSDKIFTEGHKKRYNFAIKLEEHFGDKIDLFGRGIRDFDDKWEVLAPYKYSIAIENLNYQDWLTEKLPDCFLALTFPFYYGCPNVINYFEPNSFVNIDIENISNSIRLIEKVITDPSHYSSSLGFLEKEKEKYLDKRSFFPLCVDIVSELPSKSSKSSLKIIPESELQSSKIDLIYKKILKITKKVLPS
ncbi:hypothetical protein H6G45_18255 [Synechocystis sp. FACHB-383]|uniref:glycosyltransferase family 10 domain-containing protein n=1 Tax=Synechocystis sp. FACHB-383 TaxID=2692864 RepID=UPI001688BBBA|nr:glycosyltransferase family 10 [Synechocystis sp. FACHB-383]MBD2655390.1 hypothetical protein [Synechocystis sp. FACHB-383]